MRAASVFGQDDYFGQREAFLDVDDGAQPRGVVRRVALAQAVIVSLQTVAGLTRSGKPRGVWPICRRVGRVLCQPEAVRRF